MLRLAAMNWYWANIEVIDDPSEMTMARLVIRSVRLLVNSRLLARLNHYFNGYDYQIYYRIRIVAIFIADLHRQT